MSITELSRRKLLQLLATQFAAVSVDQALGAAPRKENQPNVIFLLADDVGYGDLACLGNPVIRTPHLDNLYAESIRFTDFHVSPTCAPSRASLMTGRYNNATGVWHTVSGRNLLDPTNVTMPECFKSSGYATGIFGKWHLGDNYPCRTIDFHFDESIVCGGGGIWQTPDYFGNDDRDDAYNHNGKFEKYLGYSTDIFFDRAMDFIDRAQERRQPFFCYIPTPAAHVPVWALDSDTAPYIDVPGLSSPGFYGMIANIDANLGRLRQFLEARGLTENTILMYAGDNGSADGVHVFNADMRGEKSSPYEGGHRVPFFIFWPAGGLTGGRDISTLTAHIDLLPTLAELCQLKQRGDRIDGTSWRPLLYESGSQWQSRTVVIDSQRQDYLRKWKETAVMTQQWRLVSPTADGDEALIELYDIVQDPGETNDIAAQHPEVVKSLKAQYDVWWKHASALADQHVRIILGSNEENPSFLNCMDWHGEDAILVWNQEQIRSAPVANGFWTVYVSRQGRYRFELRRWPSELDLPVNAPYIDPLPNMEKTPGTAIAANRAQLSIGEINESKPVHSGDKYAEFEVTLSQGPAELRAAFHCEDGTVRGAYYVYAERLHEEII
jgi:arylsulfatase A-like enzyme